MMIDGTETLAVCRVECVGVLSLLPAYELAHSTLLPMVAVELNVKQACALQFKRYPVVNTVYGQLHIQPLHHLIAPVQHGNCRNLFSFLHGHQNILLALFQAQHDVLLAQHIRCDLCLHGRQRHHCHHCH